MTPPHTLWITRAQPGADATAERLRRIGLTPVIAPLLVVHRIADATVDLTEAAAIVFTSANGVDAFADLSPERQLRVFAVGDATAAAARRQRFKSVLSTQGDVPALASALIARRRELRGVIVYPAAAEPSQDLAAALSPAGLTVRQTPVYETVAAPPPASLLARLPEIDGVLVHSAKAASALAEVLIDHPAPHLTAYCLSRQIAAPLHDADLTDVHAAFAPSESLAAGVARKPRSGLTRLHRPARQLRQRTPWSTCCGTMSAAPDPAELAPSRDPAAYGGRRLFTGRVFAWLIVCLVCVGVGLVVGRYGWNLAPTKPEAPPSDAVSRLGAPAPAPLAPTPPFTTPQTAPPSSAPPDGALDARVARLEAGASQTDAAAAGALAAAALSEAAQGSSPFGADLAAYERLAPDDPDLRALAPLAALGAPNRAELGASFPDRAARAAVAAHEPAKDASLLAKLSWMIGRVVIVRRVSPDASGVDGVLYKAQLEAGAGDLEDALVTLRALPTPARAALQDWTDAAARRVEIDRRVAAVRARGRRCARAPSRVNSRRFAMIRILLAVVLVLIAAVVVVALRGDPGAAELTWLGWNVRATAAAAALMLMVFTLVASLLWRGLIWLAEAPATLSPRPRRSTPAQPGGRGVDARLPGRGRGRRVRGAPTGAARRRPR